MFRQGRLLLFSTELAALLAHPAVPREVDAYALAQFLTCSHLVDEHSMIRGVTVCRPATVTVWSEQGGSDRVYWQPRIGEGADDGLDAWADRMAEVLRSSVASRAHGTGLLLPVTGGLDSRAIAACLPDSARDGLRCCTFGHAHCHDVRYGRRIARALGAEFRFLPLAADFFRSYLPYATSLADGEISIEALPMLCLLDAAEPGTTQLNGYLGDALSGSDHPDLRPLPNDAARFELVWNRLFQRMGFSEAQLRIVMLPEQYAEIKDRVRDYVRRLYDEAEAPNATDNILAIKLQTRQWRYISYMGRVLGGHYRFEAPFLDNDVLDVFLSMPMAHRLDQRAYRRMLVRHAPHLAAVPEMKTHRPVSFADVYGVKKAGRPMHTPGYLPDGLEWRIKRVRHKLGGWVAGLSGGWLGLHNRDYYVHHDESIRRVATNWFRARLLEHPLAGEWFDTRALRTLWDEHLAGKMDHSIRINNVVAFLAWYENIRS
jgi:asparagine synthetase B (glutamine-hydrolysing)